MSGCTSIKTDMAFTGNVFNKSHPRHMFANFIKMLVKSKKKKKKNPASKTQEDDKIWQDIIYIF